MLCIQGCIPFANLFISTTFWGLLAAYVRLTSSCACVLAPSESRYSTASLWPASAASCSAVCPSLFTAWQEVLRVSGSALPSHYKRRHAAAGLLDATRGTALSDWPAIGKGGLGEKQSEPGAHPVVGAGVDEDLDHIDFVLPCCQMEGCGAVLQGSKAALMSALRKRLLWNDLACLQVPVRSC